MEGTGFKYFCQGSRGQRCLKQKRRENGHGSKVFKGYNDGGAGGRHWRASGPRCGLPAAVERIRERAAGAAKGERPKIGHRPNTGVTGPLGTPWGVFPWRLPGPPGGLGPLSPRQIWGCGGWGLGVTRLGASQGWGPPPCHAPRGPNPLPARTAPTGAQAPDSERGCQKLFSPPPRQPPGRPLRRHGAGRWARITCSSPEKTGVSLAYFWLTGSYFASKKKAGQAVLCGLTCGFAWCPRADSNGRHQV